MPRNGIFALFLALLVLLVIACQEQTPPAAVTADVTPTAVPTSTTTPTRPSSTATISPTETAVLPTASPASATATATSIPCPTTADPIDTPSTKPVSVYYVDEGNVRRWDEATGETMTLVDSGDVSHLTISDDGQFVAFLREIEEEAGDNWPPAPVSLWVMDSDGRNQRQLFSRDNLLTLAADDEREVFAVMPHDLTWAPGSHLLAFNPYRICTAVGQGCHGYYNELWLVDVNSSEKRQVTPRGEGAAFTFSPDGRFVTFADSTSIDLLNLHSNQRHQDVVVNPRIGLGHIYYMAEPAWAPDSSFFTVAVYLENPFSIPDPTFTIWQVAADGRRQELGTFAGLSFNFGGHNGAAAFSPNRSRIAFTREKQSGSNVRELHIAQVEGKWQAQYTVGHQTRFLSWSLDGEQFLYSFGGSLRLGQLCLEAEQLAMPAAAADTVAQWLDGERFLYLSGEGDTTAQHRLILGTVDGGFTDIGRVDGALYSYDWKR
ncbi:MAG TPA: hypothetical protein VF177_16210 [Anaerolineae bacterium]